MPSCGWRCGPRFAASTPCSGCSTIYVTHDQEEALSLADRILVMIDGQTRQIGTPEELYSRPAHADVAEFMGYRNL